MNPFTQHPQQQGISYQAHMRFAMGIALRLLNTVIAFALHAIFPFISIERRLDLEETAGFIQERNAWIENRKQAKRSQFLQTATEGQTEGNYRPVWR